MIMPGSLENSEWMTRLYVKAQKLRDWEIALWIRVLNCKHEVLNLDLWGHHKMLSVA